jgi:hypothetical protein
LERSIPATTPKTRRLARVHLREAPAVTVDHLQDKAMVAHHPDREVTAAHQDKAMEDHRQAREDMEDHQARVMGDHHTGKAATVHQEVMAEDREATEHLRHRDTSRQTKISWETTGSDQLPSHKQSIR